MNSHFEKVFLYSRIENNLKEPRRQVPKNKTCFSLEIHNLERSMFFGLLWQTKKYRTELALMINLRYILKPSKEAFDGFAI